MSVRFFNRNIPDECHQQMKAFGKAGSDIAWVAFAPGANRFSIVASSGGYFNRNIPDECHLQMGELSKNGKKVVCVAFPPAGGNSFSIVNDHGEYFNRNIPDECHTQMGELSKNGAKIVCVAFPPAGGNSFSIVNNQGAYFNRNIPDECHQQMGELSKNGAKVICVAFPKQGGNRWSVANDKGGFFNRNIDDETHMIMRYQSSVYGPVKIVAFDADGSGWSVTSKVTKSEKVCDATRCASIATIYENIQARLDGKVVGYACTVGGAEVSTFAQGWARTAADSPKKQFLPSTKITVASVAKFVTGVAAMRVLAKNKVGLDTGIGGHLPKDWKLDPNVASITFRQLLSHSSGIKHYGNVSMDYDGLKTFFTQTVDTTKNTKCQGPAVVNLANPINPKDMTRCYSNYNFAIFRILLPIIDGFVDDPAHRAQKLADAYVKIVADNVFAPVGVTGMLAKPPASGPQATGYAFSYQYPGTSKGVDWGDDTLIVGAAGWYLAIEDVAEVLNSLNKNDGRILTKAQVQDMETSVMGWDKAKDSAGNRWVEKNGGWGANNTTISTSVVLFGAGLFGAMFLNSDISGEPGVGAETVLHDAYIAALKPKS
jgi:CubicO group peptidase (beta-lactamase class C family)